MADEDKVQFQNLKNQKIEKPTKPVVQTPVQKVEKKAEEAEKKEIEQKTGEKVEEKKAEVKKPEKKKAPPKVRKYEAHAYARALPISLKYSKGIGKFIKNKKINQAIADLEMVIKKKIAVPMVGELAHKKGKGMMSGKYPMKASENFIKVLKTLNSNCIANNMELENTKVSEVIVNKAPDRMHRYGRTKFKQTHVLIKAKEKKK